MLCQPRLSWNPRDWQRQYRNSRIAGRIANWQYNLARCSVNNFRGFDAHWFWQEYDDLSKRFIKLRPDNYLDYRRRYNEDLARLEREQKSA